MSHLNDPRVLFAAERTLLAWSRTALALISLGFVIERFGLFVKYLHPNPVPGQREFSFWLGLALVGLSVLMSVLSAWQFKRVLAGLSREEIPPGYQVWLAASLNMLIAVLGVGLLIYLGREFF